MNASECRREAVAEALRAAAAAAQPEPAQKAAPRWAAARDVVVTMVPVLTKLILALAVVSSIVAVGYFGVTGTLSFSAAHVQARSFEATDPKATLTWRTGSQEPVAEPTRIHVCTYPCMCSFRACSRRWTRP